MHRPQRLNLLALGLLAVTRAGAAQPAPPLVPSHVPLHPAAQAAIDAEWLTADERSALRVFHGIWDQRDLDTPARRAVVALNAWSSDEPALTDPSVAAEI